MQQVKFVKNVLQFVKHVLVVQKTHAYHAIIIGCCNRITNAINLQLIKTRVIFINNKYLTFKYFYN